MKPYGEQPRGGKTHDADKCDVCAASRGQTGAARRRQRRRARRTEAQEIEQQLPTTEPTEQMDCDAAEGRDSYGGALDSMYEQLRTEAGAESWKAKVAEIETERDTAIADRIIADSDAWVALGKPGGTHDTTCVQRLCEQFAEVKGERDALKAKLAETGRKVQEMCESIGRIHIADYVTESVEVCEGLDRIRAVLLDSRDMDALKAQLADPRRVLIHETEVVATKEEIATLKTRLADLSEADEELHTCRALVNATSENLSVDLERMVDDLAEANEKAARSEKDSHSWHDLYEDTKAKLAALAEAAHQSVLIAKDESRGGPCGQAEPSLTINAEVRQRMKSIRVLLTPAIAAARGGAS